jgi:hypothetical protein
MKLSHGLCAVAAAALLLALHCTIMNGYSVPAEAGPDASAQGDAADEGLAADPCAHVRPPDRPPADAGATTGTAVFVSTARSVSFGLLADGGLETIGFDLDNTCCLAPDSCVRAISKCDLAGGIDDAVQDLVKTAEEFQIPLTDEVNTDIRTGANAILAWVDSYNGEADDPEVNAAVLVSPGLYDVLPDGGIGKQRAPAFTTDDAWSVTRTEAHKNRDATVATNAQPAYVRNRTLVLHGAVSVTLLAGVTFTMPEAFLVAHIGDADGGYVLDEGVVAGRIPKDVAVRAMGGVQLPPKSGNRLCDGAGLNFAYFNNLKQRMCQAQDLASNPADDGKGHACDAISFALRFVGAPASLGPLRDDPHVVYCADAAVDCPP